MFPIMKFHKFSLSFLFPIGRHDDYQKQIHQNKRGIGRLCSLNFPALLQYSKYIPLNLEHIYYLLTLSVYMENYKIAIPSQ